MAVQFIFLILPEIHLLDFAGPEHVVHAAIEEGADFKIVHCSLTNAVATSTGLPIGKLQHYTSVKPKPGDYLIIPGAYTGYLLSPDFTGQLGLFNWIKQACERGVNICSICTGAYVLAMAGVLNEKPCTTHWQLTQQLQQKFPALKVQENVLFVKHGNVYTSAGIVSGIDMALAIMEELKGAYFAHKIARELVIYNRRSSEQSQQSDFLSFRNHIHAGVHKVQDWLHENLHKKVSLLQLAEIANMSNRNFTRVFKKETGVTVNQYMNILRKERINELLKNPDISRLQIAKKCGLTSERQVSRIINDY